MRQIDNSLVEGSIQKKSYYKWLCERSGLEGPLARFLFETDYVWSIEDDENRAKDGIRLREVYSEEVGSDLSDVLKDKLKKSIHGKCSVFELLVSLAEHIDAMVNVDEEPMTPIFVGLMLENLGLDTFDEEDFDNDPEKITKIWKGKVSEKVLHEKILKIKSVTKCGKPQSLWMKLNDWVDENTDEEGYFMME